MSRTTTRRLGVAAATLATAGLFGACTGAPTASPPTGSAAPTESAAPTAAALSGEIEVIVPVGGGAIAFEELVSRFKAEHPEVTVKLSSVPGANLSQTVSTQLRAGHGPDVIYGSTGRGNANSLIPYGEAGYLADLAGLSYVEHIPDNQRDYFFVDGHVYAVPLGGVFMGMIWNNAMAEDLGITVPTTWSELISTCQNVSSQGKALLAVSGQVTGSSILPVIANTVFSTEPDWNSQRADGKVTFAGSESWKQALQRWIDMKDAGCFAGNYMSMDFPTATQLVAKGEAVARLGSSTAYGDLRDVEGLDLVIHPLPGETEATTSPIYGYADGMGINANSDNPAVAMAFVEFITQPENETVWADTTGNLSLQAERSGEYPAHLAPFKPWVTGGKTTPIINLVWPSGETYSVLSTGGGGLLTGQVTPEGLLTDMDRAFDNAK